MWTFTPIGFFSTVALRDDPDTVMIRARDDAHLLALIDRANRVLPADQMWHESDILLQRSSDYRYRVVKPKDQMVAVFADLMHGITYNNFKTEASRSRVLKRWGAVAKSRYIDALHDIWNVMYGFQEAAVTSRKRGVAPQSIERCSHGDGWAPICYDCDEERSV